MKFEDVPESGSKNYLKLVEKDTKTLIVVGDPVTYHAYWAENHYEVCPAGTLKAGLRFRCNVVYRENGLLVAKIWEGSKKVYKQLKDLNDEYDLDTIMIKVTRYGVGTDTEYSLLPAKEKRTAETDRAVATLALHDLAVVIKEPVEAAVAFEPAPF